MWVWTKHAEDEWRAKAKAKGFNPNLRRAGREVKIAGEKPTVNDLTVLTMRGYVIQINEKPKIGNRLTQDEIQERWRQIDAYIADGMTSAVEISAAMGYAYDTIIDFIRKHANGRKNPFRKVVYNGDGLRAAIAKSNYKSVTNFDNVMGAYGDVLKIVNGTKKTGQYLRARKFINALKCKAADILKEEG